MAEKTVGSWPLSLSGGGSVGRRNAIFTVDTPSKDTGWFVPGLTMAMGSLKFCEIFTVCSGHPFCPGFFVRALARETFVGRCGMIDDWPLPAVETLTSDER